MTKKHGSIILLSSITACLMFGFSFALVPLYNVLCDKVKFFQGVRIPLASTNSAALDKQKILVQFVTTNNKTLPWDFYPFTTEIQISPGSTTEVLFFARNNSRHTMTVQAIPSFAPRSAAAYLQKLECFCFTQQTLKPGEALHMPVRFKIVQPLPADLHTITLSYTLFDVTGKNPPARKPS